MLAAEGNLHRLTGGLRVKARVQHPGVKPRKDRVGWPWIFRFYDDEMQADGTMKVVRRYHEIAVQQVAATGVALFGEVAKMYQEGYLGREGQIAKPTRDKEKFYLTTYIIPKWGQLRLNQIQPQAAEDWWHTAFDSWWTKHGVRAIMNRVYHYAEGHGLWEEGKRTPVSRAKLGRKTYKRDRKILSFEETARVLERMDEPYKLIIETCIATGTRISEVLGLNWKHVNLSAGTIKIEQRVWHQDIDRPKSEGSRRTLGFGDLLDRYRAKAEADHATPDSFVFQQKRAPGRPLWDSGVRDALHQAAEAEGCDFPGLGPHSFRRGNISWRQLVGGSAIEASKIAGHSDLEMTSEYTFVTPERQNELTRRIQAKIAEAGTKPVAEHAPSIVAPPQTTTSLAQTPPASRLLQ